MPYPASPPDPPPVIAPPSTEEIRYSKPASTASNAAQPWVDSVSRIDTANSPPLPNPSQTSLSHASVAQTNVADFSRQAGKSRADLLGATTAAGYLLKNDKPSGPAAQISIPQSAANTRANPPYQAFTVQRSPQKKTSVTSIHSTSANLASPPPLQGPKAGLQRLTVDNSKSAVEFSASSTAQAPSVYSLSGLSGKSANTREADVMTGLDQAIALDKLQPDSSSANGTESLGPSKIVAQTAGDAPVTLPFPTVDSPTPDEDEKPATVPAAPTAQPAASPQAEQNSPSTSPAPSGTGGVIELNADRQEFDQQRQIFTAEGKVTMRFRGALLDADRLQVNLVNRLAVAEGNVALTRGDQVLRGQRFEYNFVQGIGTIQQASGVIYLPSTGTDLAFPAEGTDEGVTLNRPVSDRVTANQPVQGVSSPGSFSTSIGAGRNVSRVPGALGGGGSIRRLRFEAEAIDFTPEGWTAQNIQITNDPFSPPELVLKADRATLTRLSPLRDEVRATRPRLVFDQRLSIPLLASRVVLDRNERPPALIQFGYDDEDRGGLFAQRTFDILQSDRLRLTLTPQIFLQRMVFDTKTPFDASNYGAIARLTFNPGPRTSVQGRVTFTSFDSDEITDSLRASIRARQLVGTHTLGLEYSYRDRLFNGSLGFQTVQSSIGALLISPVITLGNSGINLTYQAGYQYINAETDRAELLDPIRDNNRVSLSRYQASAAISRGFTLWRGKALPATPTEGLRYSPVPIVPYVNLDTRLEGVYSGYSNGDSQQNLVVRVGLSGQFGNFSRRFFDYTAFNISYTQLIGSGQSPFFFDRSVDNRILEAGIIQQIYGPIRAGFQTSFSLDRNDSISTDYILEYSRRTYAITLRYNPVLAIGSLNFRISDFNWTGGSQPFSGVDVTPVEGGVRRGDVLNQ